MRARASPRDARRALASARDAEPLRRRGRPPRLSREQVVAAALALLRRDPRTLPTLAQIAGEVGAVPAALYRHFANQDELFDAVLARALAASSGAAQRSAEAPWSDALRSWMWELRDQLLRVPAVLALIGRSERTSPAWVEASSELVEILARAGLAGSELALAYLWVLKTTVGLVWQEALMPLPEQIANASASREQLREPMRARFSPILPELERIDAEAFFAAVVEQTLAAIARQLGESSGIPAASAPRPHARRARARRTSRARARARGNRSGS
jgi:AcrR family transcriptional regulator